MSWSAMPSWLLWWMGAASVGTFGLFGFDKWRAGRGGRRVTEAALGWCCAFGGWPGGLLGMIVFRHKTAKAGFQLRFAAAFLGWAGLVFAALRLTGVL